MNLRVTALDGDARIVSFAQELNQGVDGLRIVHADIMALAQYAPVDYIFSNHVLHHLPEPVIIQLFALMDRTATRRWIVSDLYRSPFAYLGFQFVGRLFRDSYSFEDGKRSIRRSLNAEEMNRHLKTAGVADHAKMHRMMPGRLVVVGTPSGR